MEMDGDGWRWMEMDGDGWRWMEMDGDGWRWMEMDGDGWRWMEMDGDGWRWMEMDVRIYGYTHIINTHMYMYVSTMYIQYIYNILITWNRGTSPERIPPMRGEGKSTIRTRAKRRSTHIIPIFLPIFYKHIVIHDIFAMLPWHAVAFERLRPLKTRVNEATGGLLGPFNAFLRPAAQSAQAMAVFCTFCHRSIEKRY